VLIKKNLFLYQVSLLQKT